MDFAYILYFGHGTAESGSRVRYTRISHHASGLAWQQRNRGYSADFFFTGRLRDD